MWPVIPGALGVVVVIVEGLQQMNQHHRYWVQYRQTCEQLRRENARLAKLNARDDALSALIKQHCFPPESSSIPPQPTEPDCGLSSA